MKTRMRNTFRRLLSILTAVVMTLGIAGMNAVPAMAATDLTITVKNAQPGQTYTLYKLFDATVNSDRASKTDSSTDLDSEVQDNGIAYTLPTGKQLSTSYTYTNSANQSTTVTGTTWFKMNGVNVEKADNVDTIDFASEDFRYWASQFGTKIGDSKKNEGTTVADITFSNLTDGYYYVTSTTGSLITVTSIAPNAIIKDKNTAPDVNKTEDVKTSSVGEDVTYTVEVSLTTGASNVIFHDRLGDGLSLNGVIAADTDLTAENSPLTVKDGTTNLIKGTDYTVDFFNATKAASDATEAKTRGDNITITFTESYLNKLTAQKTITLVYSAKVNSSAAINMPNEAFVSYGESNTESVKKTVYESALGFVINKVDGSNSNAQLNGAKFALSKDGTLTNLDENSTNDALLSFDNSGTLITSGGTKIREANNSLTFKGLNDNTTDTITYYLYEVKAPDGYNKLTGPIEIQMIPRFDNTVNSEHQSKVTGYTLQYKMPGDADWTKTHETDTDIEIENHSFSIVNTQGSLLPSTGGNGTTIFYVAGGALIVLAAVLLIARRKRNA